MPKEKFNPIAKLPTLPGEDAANDELRSNTTDSTYPPTEPLNNEIKKTQLEINSKPIKSDEAENEKNKKRHLAVIRITIIVLLAILIFLGILLTLRVVPKIISNVPNFGQTFRSLFVSDVSNISNISDSDTTQTSLPAATSTPPLSNAVSTSTYPTATYQPKTPARLLVGILSTNTFGNRTFVRFNVQNVGGTPSGTWSFSANLPSSETPTYYSNIQNSIAPQNGIIYTLGFIADRNTFYTQPQITLYTNQGTYNPGVNY